MYKVKVRFRQTFSDTTYGSKQYDYLSLEPLEEEDLVVVETQNGLSVAKVTRICTGLDSFKGHKFVVQKISTKEVEAYKLKVAKVEMIKAEIDEKVRERLYLQQVEALASEDPVLAKLLEELKNI